VVVPSEPERIQRKVFVVRVSVVEKPNPVTVSPPELQRAQFIDKREAVECASWRSTPGAEIEQFSRCRSVPIDGCGFNFADAMKNERGQEISFDVHVHRSTGRRAEARLTEPVRAGRIRWMQRANAEQLKESNAGCR